MGKKRLVFMNGGKHFWNREKDIVKGLINDFEILLVVNHSKDNNYSITEIINYTEENNIQLKIIDYTNRRASSPQKIFSDLKNVLDIKKFKPDLIYLESFGSPYFALFAGLFFNPKKTIFAILDYKLHPYEESSYKFSEKFSLFRI